MAASRRLMSCSAGIAIILAAPASASPGPLPDARVAAQDVLTAYAKGGRTFPIRFGMVWRLERHAGRPAQSSGVAPTVGQSAAAPLGAPP